MKTSQTIRAAKDIVEMRHTIEPVAVDEQGNLKGACMATATAVAVAFAGFTEKAKRAWFYVGAQCGGLGLIPSFSKSHTQAECVAALEAAAVHAERDGQ